MVVGIPNVGKSTFINAYAGRACAKTGNKPGDVYKRQLEYSLEPNVNQPYSEYTVKVEAEGYEPVEVTGSELLSGEQSVQPVSYTHLHHRRGEPRF